MLKRRFTLRRWVHEPGELDRASDGSANGQGLQSSATAGPMVAHRAAPRRSKPQVLRAACFFAATLVVSGASAGLAAVPAQAAGIPTISAPPNVVVGEADGSVTLPVTLSAASTSQVTVNYATQDGSGQGEYSSCEYNSIYEGQSGTLTFTPGQTTQNVTIKLLDCGTSLSSGFYTFYLNLSSASGGTIADTSTQVDVTGNTPAKSTPGLFVKNAVVDTSVGTVEVPVVLGGPSGAALGAPVTVNYSTVDGSAQAGTDYTAESGTLNFKAGETAQNIAVPITDRNAATRSFSVVLSSPSSNATIATGTGTVTIEANNGSAVTTPGISAPPNVVVGAADGYIDLPVTLSAPGINTTTVKFTTQDGSGQGEYTACEYSAIEQGQSGTLTFTPGVTTQVVRVPLLNCGASLSSGFYTFYLNLSSPSGASMVDGSTQVDVTGNAPGGSTSALFVKNAVVDASVGTLEVPVVLGGPSGSAQGLPVTVNYTTANGSAKAGTDYTAESGTLTFPAGETAQNIAVPITDRNAATRSFSVVLSSPSSNATIATGTGTVTIEANNGSAVTTPGISAPPNVVVGAADGYIDLPVTLSAPGINTTTVKFTTQDGSGQGEYTACEYSAIEQGQSGTLTFTPGVTTQVVRVPLLNCGASLSSGFYTFYLNLSSPSGASMVDGSTQVDVTGNAPGGSTSALFVKNAVVDASVGTLEVPVVLGGPSGSAQGLPVTVNYTTANGSAKAGTDYTAESGTLTFPAGETAQNIAVPITDRNAATRSFSVVLSSPSSNATIATGTGTVTIEANNGSAVTTPGISAPPNVVVGAADGYIDLPVTLSAPGINTTTVKFTTQDGSGQGEYTACEYSAIEQGQSGTLTFTPGVTTQVVRVPLLNCGASLSSGFYTFYLNLSSPSGASMVDGSTQVDVTGNAPGGSTSALFVKNAVVDASVGTLEVPVVLGGPSGSAQGLPVTVNYTTANGSAKAGTDYTAESGTLTFPAGETAQNIAVPITDRNAATRSFSVVLSSPSSNATIATGTGTVTIEANNGSAVTTPGISAPPNVVVGAADGYIDLPVTLSAPGINTTTVKFTTQDGSGQGEYTACEYSAIYQGQSGTLTFTPGVTTQVVRVPLLNCPQTQNLTFTLNLSGASGGTITDASTTVTVGDFPTITAFTPTSGPVGTKVKITGSNLEGAISVKFNGKAATIKKDSANKLKVVVPAGATTGPITITTPVGSVTSTGNFTVN